MSSQTSTKTCVCTISNKDPNCNCTGDHAHNLSDAARYMLNNGGDIDVPRRVKMPIRQPEVEDVELSYMDPPLPDRHFNRRDSEFVADRTIFTDNARNWNEQVIRANSADPLRDPTGRHLVAPGGNLVEDSKFRAVNRDPLTKFESLRLGDTDIREMSIGGFKIDLELAAVKASELIPLPPARLPVIFQDSHLNFYHHFINGVYEIVRFEDLMEVINTEPLDKPGSNFMLETIEDLLLVGYERSDSEAMTLIKRMLQSTFRIETTKHRHSKDRASSLFVEANFWGFPYLESTMTCKEVDLRYWIQACYKNYETAWFNTFKSTKIPSFARSVISRSSRSSSSRPSLSSIEETSDHEIADLLREDSNAIVERKRRKSDRRSRSGSVVGSSKSFNRWTR